jgi:PadR family transcriptional regulator PadR
VDEDRMGVLKGTLELLVLKTLAGGRDMHGFQILDWIHSGTEDDLLVEEGALYPALHRMEKRGWLSARWAVSEKGRRAKYYTLTPAGGTAAEVEAGRWARYVSAVAKLAGQV